jgi:hypothetical protein
MDCSCKDQSHILDLILGGVMGEYVEGMVELGNLPWAREVLTGLDLNEEPIR